MNIDGAEVLYDDLQHPARPFPFRKVVGVKVAMACLGTILEVF